MTPHAPTFHHERLTVPKRLSLAEPLLQRIDQKIAVLTLAREELAAELQTPAKPKTPDTGHE